MLAFKHLLWHLVSRVCKCACDRQQIRKVFLYIKS